MCVNILKESLHDDITHSLLEEPDFKAHSSAMTFLNALFAQKILRRMKRGKKSPLFKKSNKMFHERVE